MDAHRVLRGLICDQALLRAVALGYARYKVLLARRARTGRRLAVLPLLGLKKLGRRDAHRRHIARTMYVPRRSCMDLPLCAGCECVSQP